MSQGGFQTKKREIADFLPCFSRAKVCRSEMHFSVKFHTPRHLRFQL